MRGQTHLLVWPAVLLGGCGAHRRPIIVPSRDASEIGPPTCTISGTVYGDGVPLPGAWVTAWTLGDLDGDLDCDLADFARLQRDEWASDVERFAGWMGGPLGGL